MTQALVITTANSTEGASQLLFNCSQILNIYKFLYNKTSTCQVTNIENIKYMRISKTTLDPYTKLFSACCKPKDHAKGFPTY